MKVKIYERDTKEIEYDFPSEKNGKRVKISEIEKGDKVYLPVDFGRNDIPLIGKAVQITKNTIQFKCFKEDGYRPITQLWIKDKNPNQEVLKLN